MWPWGSGGKKLLPFVPQEGTIKVSAANPLCIPGLKVWSLGPQAPSPCRSSSFLVVFQEEEEEARLASLPAWRRDILRKKLEEER